MVQLVANVEGIVEVQRDQRGRDMAGQTFDDDADLLHVGFDVVGGHEPEIGFVGYLTMRDRAFAVTGGRVTGARRVDKPHHEASGMEPNREWRTTVEPDDGRAR